MYLEYQFFILPPPLNNTNNIIMGDICNHKIIDKHGSRRPCKNKPKNNNLFCHVHNKTTNNLITTKYLDDNFLYTLMDMYESWADVNVNDIIFIENEYWHIEIITNHITNQLNNSNMENPYPMYPSCPFNRKLFAPASLMTIKNKLKTNKTPINITLKLLLNQPINILETIYNNVSNNFSQNILDLFNNNFRYMLTSSKNSQDIYTGLWTKKNTPLSPFEKIYNELKNMPYQIIINGFIRTNTKRDIIEQKLRNCNSSVNMYDKKYCEKL